jgi:3-oxoacyl-[acyl-carrier protein] reductase
MIILTGASGGIGKEMLQDLSKLDSVIAIYNNSPPLRSDLGENVSFYQLDLNNADDINNFVTNNSGVLNNIILVHGAGIAESSLTVNHSRDMWEAAIGVNLTANFLLTKALIPLMISQKWGRIVHFSSIRVAPGTLSYTTTKHGLLGMSKVLAKEYAKFNITSNSLILGAFNTGMFQGLKDKVKREMIAQIPSRKLGDVEDIVGAIKFFIDSPFVNGSAITIDGGASI